MRVVVWLSGACLVGCALDLSGAGIMPDSGSDAVAAVDAARSDGSPDAGAPDASAADSGGADSAIVDAGGDDAGLPTPDAGGLDAGACPSGETGSPGCPFTTLRAIARVAAGSYHFLFGAQSFETRVGDDDGGGWMLVATADETVRAPLPLTRTRRGPLRLQSHAILAPAVVRAIPDLGEVRIDSSPGSVLVTRAFSRDAYVLGQLRAYQTLHNPVPGGELGNVRWSGDSMMMDTTCQSAPVEDLDGFIFQSCGAGFLHWVPRQAMNEANRWDWHDGDTARDRLNLWVRD